MRPQRIAFQQAAVDEGRPLHLQQGTRGLQRGKPGWCGPLLYLDEIRRGLRHADVAQRSTSALGLMHSHIVDVTGQACTAERDHLPALCCLGDGGQPYRVTLHQDLVTPDPRRAGDVFQGCLAGECRRIDVIDLKPQADLRMAQCGPISHRQREPRRQPLPGRFEGFGKRDQPTCCRDLHLGTSRCSTGDPGEIHLLRRGQLAGQKHGQHQTTQTFHDIPSMTLIRHRLAAAMGLATAPRRCLIP